MDQNKFNSSATPWFKFTANKWLSGGILDEDLEAQAIFIRICAYYWTEGGAVPLDKIMKRFHKYHSQINALIGQHLIVNESITYISFLDEQLSELYNNHNILSKNGKNGAEKRWANQNNTPKNAKKVPHSPPIAPLWPGYGQAIAPQWPSIADIDIDKEKKEEEKINFSSKKSNFFSEISENLKSDKSKDSDSRNLNSENSEELPPTPSPPQDIFLKKFKTDTGFLKSIKRLNSEGKIDLDQIEAQHFANQGTQFVIHKIQEAFADSGYSYKSDRATETFVKGWINRQKINSLSDELDQKIIPIAKSTPKLESEYAKFLNLRGRYAFLNDFLYCEAAKEKESFIRAEIAKYGLSETALRILTYYAKSGAWSQGTWFSYSSLIPQLTLQKSELDNITTGRDIIWSDFENTE